MARNGFSLGVELAAAPPAGFIRVVGGNHDYPAGLTMTQVSTVSVSNTTCCFLMNCLALLISLHIRSMWETTVMHKQVSGWTVNFGPNFPESPFLELKTRKPPSPFWKTSDLGWPKFTLEYPLPFQKTSDLGWPKFTPEYPPILENFRFGMTKVYSGIPPHFGKLQIWDDQSLLQNTPHFRKLQIWDDQSLLRNTPPISENFRFGMTKVYSGIPPPPRKLSESPGPRFSEYQDLLHVETLSNPDNY